MVIKHWSEVNFDLRVCSRIGFRIFVHFINRVGNILVINRVRGLGSGLHNPAQFFWDFSHSPSPWQCSSRWFDVVAFVKICFSLSCYITNVSLDFVSANIAVPLGTNHLVLFFKTVCSDICCNS